LIIHTRYRTFWVNPVLTTINPFRTRTILGARDRAPQVREAYRRYEDGLARMLRPSITFRVYFETLPVESRILSQCRATPARPLKAFLQECFVRAHCAMPPAWGSGPRKRRQQRNHLHTYPQEAAQSLGVVLCSFLVHRRPAFAVELLHREQARSGSRGPRWAAGDVSTQRLLLIDDSRSIRHFDGPPVDVGPEPVLARQHDEALAPATSRLARRRKLWSQRSWFRPTSSLSACAAAQLHRPRSIGRSPMPCSEPPEVASFGSRSRLRIFSRDV